MKSNKKSVNEFIKSMTQEDWDNLGDEVARQLEQEKQELIAFSQSSRFTEVLNQITSAVSPDKSLTDNPYQEPLIGDVSNEEFIKVFSFVFNEKLSKAKVQPLEGFFYSEQVEYAGVRFIEMHGQGTAFMVQGMEFKSDF